MKHQTRQSMGDSGDRFHVDLTQPRVPASGICQIESGVTDARIDSQPDRHMCHLIGERVELRNRVEDHLVGKRCQLSDLVSGVGDAICVRLLAKVVVPEPGFEQRRRRGAVEMLGNEVEDRPGGKAFQCQQRFGSRAFTNRVDHLKVLEKPGFVNQVVRRARFGHLTQEAFAALCDWSSAKGTLRS